MKFKPALVLKSALPEWCTDNFARKACSEDARRMSSEEEEAEDKRDRDADSGVVQLK